MQDFIVPDRRGLVAEYLLNSDAKDTSGNGYNGTASNVTYSKTDRGYQTYKGDFNGSNSNVDLPTIPSLSDFTVSVVANGNSAYSEIVFFGNSSDNANFELRTDSSDKLVFQTYNGGVLNFTCATSILPSKKYHILAIRSGSNGYVYVNGKLDGSGTVGSFSMGSDRCAIGYARSNGTARYNGSIQSVRIFNRALSETEIRNWHLESLRALGGSSLAGLTDGLVAQINTADGSELSDIVGGVAVTKTSGTATTDNLGYTRAVTNPNYTWPSITYTTGYAFENAGSGWVLTQTPSGLSATGINRTTTLREVFLFNRTLTADEKNALETLCKLDYVLPFDGATRYGLPPQLKEGCVLFIPGIINGTTAYDASSSGNNGTLVGSPTKTRGGLHGYEGLKFDGTSQYVTIPNATLNVSEFTLAATVNVTAGGGDDTIFHFRNQENLYGWCIFSWSKGDGGRTVNSPYFAFYGDDLNTSVGLDTGRTYRMVARYKGGVQSIFVDGKLFASRTAAANPMVPTTSRIGVRSDTLTQYLGGNVTNPIIWNRGLTDDQIRLDASTFFVP